MRKLKFNNKTLINIILLFIVILVNLSDIVKAVTVDDIIDHTKKASLEIVKYENAHGTGLNTDENKPLKGVEFTIYKLDEANIEKTADEIAKLIEEGTVMGLDSKSLTTGENGIVKFTELELGRYLVVETKVPKNVTVKMNPFLIDLPRTSDDGQSWDYTVKVEPKNETVYGEVELLKTGEDGNALAGTTWELQMKNGTNYEKYDYEGELITNSEGKIKITGLPVGVYRLVETANLEGYILDQSAVKDFTITAENTSFKFTAINEKPNISKEVKNNSGYSEHASAYDTEEVEWRVTSEVPSIIGKMDTYYIEDTLPEGLEYKEDSLAIEGLILNIHYEVVENDGVIKITFNTEELAKINKDKVVITYKTTFTDDVSYGKELVNSANLTYTNKINTDGTEGSKKTSESDKAEVHTGAVLIKKTDNKGKFLSGAKFKIATTEENAKDGKYVKDLEGNDIVAISDENGNVIFSGLKYGVDNSSAEEGSSLYYIVEFESPTYTEEDGTIKHYNLLKEPVEVEVNSISYTNVMASVVNKKGFILPLTGGSGAITLVAVGITLIGIAIRLNRKEQKV